MDKKESKLTKAAHIKRHTQGTSNEISFSVLDAAKSRLDAEEGKVDKVKFPKPGGLPVLTWRMGRKKLAPTPTKEDALPLSSGDVVSGGGATDSSTPTTLSASLAAEGTVKKSGYPSDGSSTSRADRGSSNDAFASIPLTTAQQDEIDRRKSRRRFRRILMMIIGIAVTFAVVFGVAYFLYNEITHHQEQVSQLDQALAKFSETDATVVAIDKIINGSLEDTSVEQIQRVIDDIPHTDDLLDDAERLATSAENNMRDSSDKEAADQALSAVSARREMLVAAQVILEADVQAIVDKENIEQAWETVLQADGTARDAAALVTDTTPENVTRSMEKTNEATTLFTEALEQLNELTSSTLDLELTMLTDYVTKRIESMGYAIASDEAILAQDRQTAESQNELYNTSEAEASVLAGNIPEDIGKPVLDAYKRATDDALEEYSQARIKASTADAFLRDYLGT